MNHECIVKYLGHNRYGDSHELHIYMEFIPQSLYHMLQQCRQNSETVREKNILAAAYAIARGVQYLHELDKPIVHRDIKSKNVSVDCLLTGSDPCGIRF